MILTDTSICSEDIKLFEQSNDTGTIKWLKFFYKYDPYNSTLEEEKELISELTKVKELIPNSTNKKMQFKNIDVKDLVYASKADRGQIPPTTSKHAYGILIARMVLAYYLVSKKKAYNNGQSIAEQVHALGFKGKSLSK